MATGLRHTVAWGILESPMNVQKGTAVKFGTSTRRVRGPSCTRQIAIALFATMLAACGGGDGEGENGRNGLSRVTGVAQSVLNGAPQAARDFQILDLEAPADSEPVATGVTDSNGAFDVLLRRVGLTYIVFPPSDSVGEPRTSGLISLDNQQTQKTLNDFTDVACVAGVTAVLSGDLDPALLTQERIDNLESAAAFVIQRDNVDFTDDDSVNAAAQEVRDITNDGANPHATL